MPGEQFCIALIRHLVCNTYNTYVIPINLQEGPENGLMMDLCVIKF